MTAAWVHGGAAAAQGYASWFADEAAAEAGEDASGCLVSVRLHAPSPGESLAFVLQADDGRYELRSGGACVDEYRAAAFEWIEPCDVQIRVRAGGGLAESAGSIIELLRLLCYSNCGPSSASGALEIRVRYGAVEPPLQLRVAFPRLPCEFRSLGDPLDQAVEVAGC